MQKKIIWTLLGVGFLWILFDFGKELYSNNESKEAQLSQSIETDEEESLAPPIAQTGIKIGQVAYDFELQDMAGNQVKLSDYRGKKVFLNFWASWCPPCKAEMPHLQEYSDEQDETVVLGVNVTTSENNPGDVEVFLEEYAISFTNLYGTVKQFQQYQVQSMPTSYLIGSDGIIYERIVGPVTKDMLETKFSMIK